jgi:hypothetical protein
VAIAENNVNSHWVMCLGREDAASLSALRLVPGIEVAEDTDRIWLRGQNSEEKLSAKLSALPARARYELIAPNQLRQIGQRIPSARLPAFQWRPLDAWLQVELPSAAMPAEPASPVQLRLIRSIQEQEPDLLQTHLDQLIGFAAMAAQVRLDRLQFAANKAGDVLVRGQPLPPVPGRRFVTHGGVAIPAGYGWEPRVSPEVLARCFAVATDALVLWQEDNTFTRLHSEQFVPLSRRAIFATQAGLSEAQ